MSILLKNYRNTDDSFTVNRVTYNAVKKHNVTTSLGIVKIGEEILPEILEGLTKIELLEFENQWSEIKNSVRKVELSNINDVLIKTCAETQEAVALNALSPDKAHDAIKSIDATRRALKSVLRAYEKQATATVTDDKEKEKNSSSLPEQIKQNQSENISHIGDRKEHNFNLSPLVPYVRN